MKHYRTVQLSTDGTIIGDEIDLEGDIDFGDDISEGDEVADDEDFVTVSEEDGEDGE